MEALEVLPERMNRIGETSFCQRLRAEDVAELIDDLRLGNPHYGEQECMGYHRQSRAYNHRELPAIREPPQPALGPAAHVEKVKKIA